MNSVQDVNLLSSFKIIAKYITLEYLPTYPTLHGKNHWNTCQLFQHFMEKISGILANLYTGRFLMFKVNRLGNYTW